MVQIFFGGLATVGALAATAEPVERAITGGVLMWPVSEALADPRVQVTVSGGAMSDGARRPLFPAVGGSFDPARGTATVAYGGTVTVAREGRSVIISNPVVAIDGDGATLSAGLEIRTQPGIPPSLHPTPSSTAPPSTEPAPTGTATVTATAAPSVTATPSPSVPPTAPGKEGPPGKSSTPGTPGKSATPGTTGTPNKSGAPGVPGVPSAAESAGPSPTQTAPVPSASVTVSPTAALTPTRIAAAGLAVLAVEQTAVEHKDRRVTWSAVPTMITQAAADALHAVLGEKAALAPATLSLTYEQDSVADVLSAIRGEAVTPCPTRSSGSPSGTPTGCGTPTGTPTASPTRTSSQTPTPTPTPTRTPSPTPTKTTTKSKPPTRTVQVVVTPAGKAKKESLAKTGDGYVLPLLTAGLGLIVGGGITIRASRRTGYLREE
ncbi:hypothetical protein [Nonomuraea endophytica]|uniref:hypothetical protein n=1 Tax=Nonomuraea endophytica TaxID=714136 RepID=UPI0037C89BC9